MKHSTMYLYNLTPKTLLEMSYKEAIELKIESARDLLKHQLLRPHFTKRDTTRIAAVYKAIKFNESLLDELTW